MTGSVRLDRLHPDPTVQVQKVRQGSPLRRIAFLALGAWGLWTLLGNRSEARRWNRVLCVPLGAYAALVGASVLWSEDPSLTARRVLVFALSAVGAAGMAVRFSLRDLLRWAFLVTALQAAVGIGAELVAGTFLDFSSQWRFSGTLHPNHQALNCGVFSLSGAVLALAEKRFRSVFALCSAAGLLLVILTGSRTGFVSTVAGLVVVSALRFEGVLRLGLASAGLSVACLCVVFFGDSLASSLRKGVLLGRESESVATLTGRLPLWEDLTAYVVRKPLVGYGYGGFWTAERILRISYDQGWGISEAHMAYLDLLLGLGVAGLCAFGAILAAALSRAFRGSGVTGEGGFAFAASLLIMAVLDGCLESALVNPTAFTFIATCVALKLAHSETGPGRTDQYKGHAAP